MGTIQRQGIINTILIYAGILLGFVNSIIVQPYFLREDEVGLTRVMIAFGGMLTPFLLLGASSTCLRFFPAFRDKSSRHHGFFGLILLIPTVGIIAGGIIIWVLKRWIVMRYAESPLFVKYFDWTFPLAAVMTLSIAVNAYSNSHLKTTVPSFLNDVWVRVLLIVFTLLYSFHFLSLDLYVASIWGTYFTQLLFLFVYVYRIDRPSLRPDWNFVRQVGWRSILRYSSFMALTALSSLSLKFLDTVMVGAYISEKAAAVYAIGAFIAQFIETPLYSLERVAAAQIAHAWGSNNLSQIDEIYRKSVRYLFLAGGFLVVCVITNIYSFLSLLPAAYHDAANVTILMGVGSIVNMATGVNTPIISNSSKYSWNMIFLLVLLVTSVSLNMLLIPRFGMEGAALATGLASMIFNLMKFFFIWKNFGMQPYDGKTLRTLLIIGCALATGIFLPVPANPWFAMAVRGSAITLVYVTLTLWLRIVPEYEHLLLDRIPGLKKKNKPRR